MKTAVVIGFDYHVRALCRRMNRHAAGWRFAWYPASRLGLARALRALVTADMLVRVGGPAPHPSLMALARLRCIPVIIIWVGTDVLNLTRNPSLLSESHKGELVHLAVAPWLVDELKCAGVYARYLPIIGVETTDPTPNSLQSPCVLTYLPEPRRAFYGRDFIYEVARGLPEMRFLAVGAGRQDTEAPANVRYLGWRPGLNDLYDQCFAVLRVPEHDGMSLVVLEALARGRFVLWKYSLPGVQTVATPEDARAYLRRVWDEQRNDGWRYNAEGLAFVREHYEVKKVAHGLAAFLDSVLEEFALHRKKKRLAVIGHDVFCADVVRLTNHLPTGWCARALHFTTRIEYMSSLLQVARADVLYSIGQPDVGKALRFVTKLLRKPRVVHWVGSDIRVLASRPELRRNLLGVHVSHVAEIEWEVEDLRSLGIEATIAPLPPRLTNGPALPPLPDVFTVLTYLPTGRTAFYGGREVEMLIRDFALSPVRFIIVGGGRIEVAVGAPVENVGWTHTLGDVYARSTVLVRFTSNDGLSLMVLEALAMGRHVLWTKSFPFVQTVATYEELRRGLRELFDRHSAGRLVPQWEASQYVRTGYDPARCVQGLVAQWEKVTSYRRIRL